MGVQPKVNPLIGPLVPGWAEIPNIPLFRPLVAARAVLAVVLQVKVPAGVDRVALQVVEASW